MEDAARKANVEVAIVHLVKKADVGSFVTMDLLRGMQQDAMSGEALSGGYAEPQQLALPANEIENRVLIFNAAVTSAREAILARAQASAYAGMIGDSMGDRSAGKSDRESAPSVDWVRGALDGAYADLKDRAWASVVRSADVTTRLSSAAQKRVESEFKLIAELEFTVANIYSFLVGICEQQGKIQIDMLCDTFDRITRYHSDNTAYYRGWRSNDKHYRSIGRRLRYTRFIIPGFSAGSWRSCPEWEMQSLLADFDKGFALLAGDAAPPLSLVSACNSNWTALMYGARIESTYFDNAGRTSPRPSNSCCQASHRQYSRACCRMCRYSYRPLWRRPSGPSARFSAYSPVRATKRHCSSSRRAWLPISIKRSSESWSKSIRSFPDSPRTGLNSTLRFTRRWTSST